METQTAQTQTPEVKPQPAVSKDTKSKEASSEQKADLKTAGDLLKKYDNKSLVIRELTAKGWETGRIAKALGIRYQFAYNVRNRPLKGDLQAPVDKAPKSKEKNTSKK